jgi:hypothetical protein
MEPIIEITNDVATGKVTTRELTPEEVAELFEETHEAPTAD